MGLVELALHVVWRQCLSGGGKMTKSECGMANGDQEWLFQVGFEPMKRR